MKPEKKVRISVIYSFSILSLSIYFGIYNILVYFSISPGVFLSFISLISLGSIFLIYREKDPLLFSIAILSFLMALGIMLIPQEFPAPGDFMDAFVLILVASLIAAGVKNTYKFLYDGLAFYLVGIFLLFTFTIVKILILLADVLDYYINCLGESCSPYPFVFLPSILLFFLVIPALYPYFAQNIFRRDVNDKESS